MKLFRSIITTGLFCLLLIAKVNAQSNNFVILKGQLKGFNNQVNIEEMSAFQYLLPPTSDRMIIPDSAGNFNIKIKVPAASYYRLGRNALYLTPGDNLQIYVDYGNPTKATFKGKGAEANTYLMNTPFPKGGSFIEAGKQVKPTVEETIATVEEMAQLRTKELEKLTNVSDEFKRLENARIKADLINSLIMGENYSVMKLKLKNDEAKAFTETYKQTISPKIKTLAKGFIDPSLMKLVVYRDIADVLIEEGGKPEDVQTIKDFYTASALVGNMQKISDKKLLVPFKEEISKLKTPTYKTALDKMMVYLMAFGKGDPAVDFTAIDMNGQKVNLSSLKGKVIYVDLWATWCGPCMQEMPSYEQLKTKYKYNPNVAFVSLSIDDSSELWKGSIAQRKADGYQWIINRSKLQAYNIVGIPRSLLIDKDFKMVDMAAPMPSQATAAKAIDALLK